MTVFVWACFCYFVFFSLIDAVVLVRRMVLRFSLGLHLVMGAWAWVALHMMWGD